MKKNILISFLLILLIISIGINIKFIYGNKEKDIASNIVVGNSNVVEDNSSENKDTNIKAKVPNSLIGTWNTGSKRSLYYVLEINDDGTVIYTTYNYAYNIQKDNGIIEEKYYTDEEREIYRKSRGYINNFVVILDENYDIKNDSWNEADSQDVRQISLTSEVTMKFGTMTSAFVKE